MLARDILQKGFENEFIADEIYIQLCKHMTGNDFVESELRAWQLMCLSVHTFLPSPDFRVR